MIEVGEYVRNNEGYIGKIEKIIYDKQEKQNYYSCEKHNVMASGYNEQIVKHSKNIIDLLEKGDYVNEIKVTGIMSGYVYLDKIDIETKKVKTVTDYQIKSIVTKEQFKSVEYRLEE